MKAKALSAASFLCAFSSGLNLANGFWSVSLLAACLWLVVSGALENELEKAK